MNASLPAVGSYQLIAFEVLAKVWNWCVFGFYVSKDAFCPLLWALKQLSHIKLSTKKKKNTYILGIAWSFRGVFCIAVFKQYNMFLFFNVFYIVAPWNESLNF